MGQRALVTTQDVEYTAGVDQSGPKVRIGGQRPQIEVEGFGAVSDSAARISAAASSCRPVCR